MSKQNTNPAAGSIMVIAAHQDDCEVKAGGSAVLWRQAGFEVTFLVMTNGDTGHHEMGGGPLAKRRSEEAERSAALTGIHYRVLDIHNGELEPNLIYRRMLMHEIRQAAPDLILTHRPWDYHPDHRYTGQLVHDAAHSVTVPNVLALTPHMRTNPVIMYLADRFRKPYPFQPDAAVDITSVIDTKIKMAAQHVSQFYEWLPYSGRFEAEVPSDPAQRESWLSARLRKRFAAETEDHRDYLIKHCGESGKGVGFAEYFELCEYGSTLSTEARKRLFPFANNE